MHFGFRQMSQQAASTEDLTIRKHTPWISSPLETNARDVLTQPESEEELKRPPGEHVLEFKSTQVHRRDSELPVFKHHHESSTVELFYDLFFVANLSTFTSNHEINNASSLSNYIGFFTILWFTWLETSLFDVRFSSDSVFNRIAKAVSFGVMTGFAISGAIYDTTSEESILSNVKAFKAMSLILMASRLALCVQYGVVLWYVKDFQKTLVPLAGTILTLFISAMIFLGTYFGFPHDKPQTTFPNESGSSTYIAWYVVVCVEAFSVIAISCVWRIVSFKHTHLVERIGLLTLIIMGEGIIGLSKSVATLLQHSRGVTGSDIGVIVAAVLLIYFIWVLYFDQIEHDRFGTIRQQIWAILHYPLHVAILLTVEGSSMLILWNVIYKVQETILGWYPTGDYGYDYVYWGFHNTTELVYYIHYGIDQVAGFFKDDTLINAYNRNITMIEDCPYKFGTLKYDEYVGPIVDSIWFDMERVAFNSFGVEAPESRSGEDAASESDALFAIFNQVWVYFFLAGGGFLLVLAVMYWFGKTHKTKWEYFSILVRVVFGIGLCLGCLENWVNYTTSSANFVYSPWPLITMMLGYFIVIVLDNLLVWHTNKTIATMTSAHRMSYSLTDSLSRRDGQSREAPSQEHSDPEAIQSQHV